MVGGLALDGRRQIVSADPVNIPQTVVVGAFPPFLASPLPYLIRGILRV